MARIFEDLIVRSIRDSFGVLLGGSAAPPGVNAPGMIFLPLGNGVSVIAAGIAGDIFLPFAGVLTGWTILADQNGDAVIDLWKDTYANYPPTNADTITAAAKPTLAAGNAKAQSAALTGWTRTFSAGDTLRVNVDSANTVTRIMLALSFYRA